MSSKVSRIAGMASKVGEAARRGFSATTRAKDSTVVTQAEASLPSKGGRVGRRVKRGLIGAGVAIGAADAATWIGEGFVEGFGERERALEAARLIRSYERMVTRQVREAEQLVARNQDLLLRNMPHLAEEVASGRRLPKGAVVFGRKRHVDELAMLAEAMARGGFPQPEGAVDPVAEALAGVPNLGG